MSATDRKARALAAAKRAADVAEAALLEVGEQLALARGDPVRVVHKEPRGILGLRHAVGAQEARGTLPAPRRVSAVEVVLEGATAGELRGLVVVQVVREACQGWGLTKVRRLGEPYRENGQWRLRVEVTA